MKKTISVTKQHNFITQITTIYLCFVLFCLPLYFTNGFFNITEAKHSFFYITSFIYIIIAFGGLVCKCIFVKKDIKEYASGVLIKIKELSYLDISFIMFAISTLISSIISPYYNDVWIGENARFQGAITILLYVIIYFLISKTYHDFNLSMLCLVLSFVLVSLIGVLNCFGIDVFGIYNELSSIGKKNFISTIGNVNFFSGYISLIFPIVMYGFCTVKDAYSKIIYTVALVVGTFGIMITSSDSFVVGFVVSLLLCFLFVLKNSDEVKRFFVCIIIIMLIAKIFLIIYNLYGESNIKISKIVSSFFNPLIFVIVLLFLFALWAVLEKNILNAFLLKKICLIVLAISFGFFCILVVLSNAVGINGLDEYFKITSSWGSSRGYIWKECIYLFNDFNIIQKLFGIGPETLQNLIGNKLGNKILDQAHNEYLQHLLTIGIFGLISYLLIIFNVIRTVFKNLKENLLAKGLLLSLAGYWAQAFFNIAQPFTTPLMFILISVIGGINNVNKTQKLINSK